MELLFFCALCKLKVGFYIALFSLNDKIIV